MGDYTGEDGLLYCGKCKMRKEKRMVFRKKESIVRVICQCECLEKEKEDLEWQKQQDMIRISRLRSSGIQDKALREYTFETDNGSNSKMDIARKYVDTWEIHLNKGDGLLLWGGVGTGKTFMTACIANALVNQGVPVLVTSFSRIVNGVFASADKNAFIDELMKYKLLVIDDLGAERNTEYVIEIVYNIIDERYKSRLPLIVTTNLGLNLLKNETDIAFKRIYDRVLTMCVPVAFTGTNLRDGQREELMERGKLLK